MVKKCYDCFEWGDECLCGFSEYDLGDDSFVEEVNKENGV